ncbi:unnamed protein product, partial [Coregonus sp. 'balchen']
TVFIILILLYKRRVRRKESYTETSRGPEENTFHKSCFKMMECLKLGVTEGLRVTCCNWDNYNV